MHVLSINLVAHAAHKLDEVVEAGHACSRLHGHSYRISTEIAILNDPKKLIVDFGAIKRLLKERYDHQYLNEIMSTVPTAENMALDIYQHLKVYLDATAKDNAQITNVTVAETDDNIATYVPDEETSEES